MGPDDSTELGNGERKTVISRMRHIEKLLGLVEGNLVKSSDPEEINRYLFDRMYYMLALWQLQAIQFRSSGNLKDAKEATEERVIFYNLQYNSIIQNGNWGESKKDFILLSASEDALPEDAERFGLDPAFTFNGVQIFSKAIDANDRQNAWIQLVESKMDLIPDITTPYTPTNLQELQTSLDVV